MEVKWETPNWGGTKRACEAESKRRLEATPILAQIREHGLSTALKPYEDRLAGVNQDYEDAFHGSDKYRTADTPEDEVSEVGCQTELFMSDWRALEEHVALALLGLQKALAAYDAAIAKYPAKDAA